MAPDPDEELKDEKNPRPLDEDDIALLKTYVYCSLFRRFGIFPTPKVLIFIRISPPSSSTSVTLTSTGVCNCAVLDLVVIWLLVVVLMVLRLA